MAKSVSTDKKDINPHRPNGWFALKEIMLASLTKGQFLVAILGLIILVVVYRMPAADLTKIALELIGLCKSAWYYGWILFVTTFIVSVSYVKKLQKTQSKQIERLNKDMLELRKPKK